MPFPQSIRSQDVELMWIFHDIGEIGLDSDIPGYRKTKLDRLNEEKKAIRILSSINHRQLRTTLLDLHARCALRSSDGTDREAAICAFVDKLEAAIFIGASGIGEVWKKRAGSRIFQRIVRKNALGAFIGPASNLSRFLDPDGRAYLCDRIASVVTSCFERGLISKRFFEDRMAAIEIALQSAHH